MFRLFSTIIIIIACYSNFVFASSKQNRLRCDANEILSACANRACDYRKCSEVGQPIECVMLDRKYCKRGCICVDDYLRADNGTCIPASQCPNARKCPKPNEYYDLCPPQCPSRTCAVMDDITCPEPLQAGDPRCPPPSCRCNVGFYRDSDGNCVTWNLCKQCPENETQTQCFEGRCERRDCSDIPKPVVCVNIDTDFCTVGCLCKDGFLRAQNGTCIPINQCPEAQCKEDENFDTCPPTCPGEQCGVDPSTALCSPSPQPGDPSCQPSCRCRKGYLRNSNGKCIPQSQCPKCPANEIQTQCFEGRCERRDCSDIPKPVVCVKINPDFCTVGCLCRDGFLRALNGTCIPINQCPEAQCKDDEIFDACAPTCPGEQCGVDPSTALCSPSPQPGDPSCQPRCRCRKGYLRNNKGKCIPQSQCPKCPANEIQTQCFEGRCERRDCSDIPKPVFCVKINPDFCTVGCLCRDGFLRAQNGTCIPINQCPEAQCKDDEIFDACAPTCPGEQCGVDPSTALCSPSPQPGDPSCQPRCRCRKGYLRNNRGKCIPQSQCPKCPANEIQTQCFEGRCERRDCSDIPKPVVCVRINPDFCTVGCLCRDGFLRALNGTCIPINQCPEAQCQEDEIFDACAPTCPGEQCGVDPSTTLCLPSPQPGDPSCQPSCRCRKGYFRNNNGKCVPQSQCQPACGLNEIYDKCIAPCPPRRCDVDESTIRCAESPQPGDPDCNAGCRCADNFFRNNESICVTKSECFPTCGPNEVYDTCVKQCPPQTCNVDPRTVLCPPNQECKPGCRCIGKHLRNNSGFCVPRNKCEKTPTTECPN